MKPIFKQTEVVVLEPEKLGGVDLGSSAKEIKAVVKYIGNETKLYTVGETVFFDEERSKKKTIEGEKLMIIDERYVICELKEV